MGQVPATGPLVAAARLWARMPRPCRRAEADRSVRDQAGWPVARVLRQEAWAASNCSRTELLMRPRAGTSTPFALAQARIVALSELTLMVFPALLLRRARPPTLRPWSA